MSEHVFVQMLFDPGPAQARVRRRPAPRSRYVPAPRGVCWRCWHPSRQVVLSPADYARLLGLYLGNGRIIDLGATQRLELFVDPAAVAEAAALLRRCFPDNRVGRSARRGGTAVAAVHHSHLRCLFPPHDAEPWQDEIVASAR